MIEQRRPVRQRPVRRLRRAAASAVAALAALAVALPLSTLPAAPAVAAPGDDDVLRVLLFSSGDGVHGSVANTRAAVREMSNSLAVQYGLDNSGQGQAVADIQETTSATAFTPENLATKDVLVFAHTAGVLFNTEQRAALEAYIRGGGGFVGIHYTSWSPDQTEHDVNPFYRRLVGAAATGHPEPAGGQRGTINLGDAASPLTAGLPETLSYTDEWYEWDVNPSQDVHTLVTVDESSYPSGTEVGEEGTTHPVTWCQTIDQGRSWYSSLGHHASAWTAADDGGNPNDNDADDFVRTQMRSGLAYSAGLLPADCSPPARDDAGSWSGVTPWPLMPINMALTSDGKIQSFGSVGGWGSDATPYDWSGDSSITQGGQMEVDVWDPDEPRTMDNLRDGILPNTTYTDLFCSMQVQNPHNHSTMTVGGDDGLGGNAPNDAAIGVTSYTTNNGLQNEAPMNYPRWYPTGTTTSDGSVVVQGGSLRGGPGGPGVLTPEIYTPDEGSGWRTLDGATSALAYGDGGNGNGPDENRWWYPRAFVAPGSGDIFNITGTQMFDLDPEGNDGTGRIIDRGTLPAGIADQGANGRPIGATSTAAMYRPGKILQVGGGGFANGGPGDGARAGFTVDITGGTANPVVAATEPMTYQRHWPTATVLPDGDVMVTGGSRENNGDGGYVTNAEIWNPDTGEWTEVVVPYEHARLYHSTAILLPDGRVMIGGGGAPGPRNYTDVEYYSPSYLFDGDELATRPEISGAPAKIGYAGAFQVAASGTIDRVTLVRNGSVTHGFNNDQNFQDLEFTQSGGQLSITAPQDGTYAPPGTYMLFAFDESGTPSVAEIVDIDPTAEVDSRTPQVVDQFEYPRIPADWRGGNPAQLVEVGAGSGRMTPWTVDSPVQLVSGKVTGQGGLGLTGFQLGLGASGEMERVLRGLDPGREYRVSVRYARDARATGAAPATATLAVGDLTQTLTADTTVPSTGKYATFVGTFTAAARQQTLSLAGSGSGAGMMLDDLVVVGSDPGASDVPVRYAFEEGVGTTAANTGASDEVGDAVLTGDTGWSDDGVFGKAVDLPGGSNANAVDLPDNLLQGAADFTTSFWVRPDAKDDWIGLFHIGDGTGDAGSFFQIQMQTQAQGSTGLAATFKKKGSATQERVFATPVKDVVAEEWNHVVFTRQGSTGTLYLDGEEIASRDDLTITMADVGPTANNWLGRNGYPDPALDGQMDDVRVYTSTLSAADVAAMYAEGAALRTTTAVTTTPASPSPFGEKVTVSATVEDEAGGDAAGTAQLWIDGSSVGTVEDVADGAVSFEPVAMSPGEHQVEVRFVAADGYRDSTGTVTHTVERPPPGEGVPVHYTFDEGTGTTAANSGNDPSIGAATLQGGATWVPEAKYGAGVSLPGNGHVNLPNNITAGMDSEVSVSTWIRPTALPNWTTHVQIGKSTAEFFLLQSRTENGQRGFAATLRADNGEQFRIQLPGNTDLPLNQWTHVVVTLAPSATGGGTTGRIYFNGKLMEGGVRDNIPVGIGDVGDGGTTANFIGNGSWNDPRPTEQVDDFRLYGYELSAEDVLELYEGTPANAAPVGAADAYATDEGEELSVPAPGVLGNDTDADGDDLTATAATQPVNGEVALKADGSFTYLPDAGFSGTDTFTYKANDGTASSAATTVTLTVRDGGQPGNTAPVAGDDAYDAVAGQPLVLPAPGVLANDTDADADALTAADATKPTNGTVVLAADGSLTYTPDAGFSGKDVFTYVVGDGTATDTGTVTITVKGAGGGGGPVTSAVAGVSLPVVFGKAGSVSVAVSPASASGTVELVQGASVVASATVAGGRATLVLPAKALDPGTWDLTLRYGGDAGHRASSSSVQMVVDKVEPRMKASAPDSTTVGSRATVKIRLSAADGVPVTGTVRVKVRGGVKGSRTLTATVRNGKVVLRLPKATKPGRMRITVAYQGSDLAEKVSSKLTVRVRR